MQGLEKGSLQSRVNLYINNVVRNILSNHYNTFPNNIPSREVSKCVSSGKVLNYKIVKTKVPYVENGRNKIGYSIYFLDVNTNQSYYSTVIG